MECIQNIKKKTSNHPKKKFIEQFEICPQQITHIKKKKSRKVSKLHRFSSVTLHVSPKTEFQS